MKKKYILAAVTILISFAAFSQQHYPNNNNISYASTSTYYNNKPQTQMSVIGNPVRNLITLQIGNPVSTKYELSLYCSSGTKVTTMLYDHPAGVSTKTINVSNLQHGMYYLVAVSNQEKRSINILIQK